MSGSSPLVELIDWQRPDLQMPDDETTVMVCGDGWLDGPVCFGYHSVGDWFDQRDNLLIGVRLWADVPEGPL
jgi:hypothetical protein